MSDIYKNINSNYDRLSEAEREVIDFILKFEDIESLRLRDIKGVLYVSNSTIIRACKKLNYATFSEFKAAFVQSKEEKQHTYPVKSDFLLVLDDIKKDTVTTLELVDEKNVEQICNCLINARRIFCVGAGSSSQVASEFNRKLKLTDLWISDYSDQFSFERIPQISTEHDVVLVFSSSGQVDEINEMMIKIKGNKTKIISVTNMSASNLRAISTYSLLISSDSEQNKIWSRLMLYVMSALIYEKLITKVPFWG